MRVSVLISFLLGLRSASCTLHVLQNETTITLSNDRLTAVLQKDAGQVVDLFLDGQDLLGPQSGSTGIGPYLDCYCVPSGFYTAGATTPSMKIVQGVDSTGTTYGGMILTDTYTPTGQQFQQYWFLRDGETGLHMFSRLSYYNQTTPLLRNLQELRTLFRPNTDLWTHLTSSEVQTAPLPSKDAISQEEVVQDATWTFQSTPDDAYYTQFSEYFTKYTFSYPWRNNSVHGLYADGTTSSGTTYGAWLVMNTKDTYYGGPIHADLTVDGIVYNYLVSNHHGEGTPNITDGFDRTFGPQYYFFNGGEGSTSLKDLRAEAESLADPEWNSEFYDSIAKHVIGYAPSHQRGSVRGKLKLPNGAVRPIAVLTANGLYFQDNSAASSSYQYWVDISPDGSFFIDRVKEGEYRLTVYAEGIFGDFVRDNIVVSQREETTIGGLWKEESAGIEIWRLGIPDKSSGEFRHGNARDSTHPLQPPEYLIYWGAYDWSKDFPEGINYTIGASDLAMDFNTVHWSVFGPIPSNPDVEYSTTYDWMIHFELESKQLRNRHTATLTVQLAGAKTAAGNTDVWNNNETYNNLSLESYINNQDEPLKLTIGFNQSSSCIVRSAVSCYQIKSKMSFPAKWLHNGDNTLRLHLPFNATDTETAVLPGTVYVQYDALRLEIE
ncbi:Glycoside hydrolase-type carbohydrate-binding [Penicillium macrosclerotiorum]|uniref:Glycoside hydrolase-type carbohydrate-binding n=1 Tax=Penicillium macrosclerotiorum TaxID=303699 RepID=UPI002548037C|nr:Glycoside hydrolase-type carbohydrate-binding [Penicillium macrosclerotiorum]KAJ5666578.1 Glycoside hydrolase-type carbohydrate-binding [Penicillium macrosclerotiorum]